MNESRLTRNDWLVLRPMAAANREALLFSLQRHAVIIHRHKIPQPRRRLGPRVERIDYRPTMPHRYQDASASKFFELPLNRIERNFKIAGNRPAIGLTMMKQVEQHRFRRATSEHLRQSCGIHDLNFSSYDRNVKSVKRP